MSPLGGNEFLGPQQAGEAEKPGGCRSRKAACAEPVPDGSNERREEGNGLARQLMLLPSAEQAPAAGQVPLSTRKVVLQPTDGVGRMADWVSFLPTQLHEGTEGDIQVREGPRPFLGSRVQKGEEPLERNVVPCQRTGSDDKVGEGASFSACSCALGIAGDCQHLTLSSHGDATRRPTG